MSEINNNNTFINENQNYVVSPPTPPPQQHSIDLPLSPDFSFAGSEKDCLASAYKVIQNNEAWDLLRNFKEDSFMWTRDQSITNLIKKVNSDWGLHSGASLGTIMREMQYISKNGLSAYSNLYQ